MTARTRCGWAMFRDCGELLYGRRFPLRLNGAVNTSYVRPAILEVKHGAWKKVRLELRRTERTTVRAMCGV